jgi:hypothetical protein
MILWDKARTSAGIPRSLFHNLRRTAVRKLPPCRNRRVRNDEDHGWKTRSVFERNQIFDSDVVLTNESHQRPNGLKQILTEKEDRCMMLSLVGFRS